MKTPTICPHDVAVNAVHLAASLENPCDARTLDLISDAAIAMAEAESVGRDWEGNYDDCIEEVSHAIATNRDSRDLLLVRVIRIVNGFVGR